MIEQFVAGNLQHLGNDILIYVPQVCRQLIIKQFLIYYILRYVLVLECQCDEQPRVVEIPSTRSFLPCSTTLDN